MKLIDARGLPCPKPVILTKEAIEESSGGEVIRVLVDNAAARDN
ncbi:MAG: sulfurtransferase TusA family protein, partial [Planctomycetota bacterium]|nr:sulfurtransferase TusA family protein [Planctomycetota bacterium]